MSGTQHNPPHRHNRYAQKKPCIFKIRAPLSFTKAITHGRAGATPGKAAAMLQGAILFPFPHPLELLLTLSTGISSRSRDRFARHNQIQTLSLEAFTPLTLHNSLYTAMMVLTGTPCLKNPPATQSLGFCCILQTVPTWLVYSRASCFAEGNGCF